MVRLPDKEDKLKRTPKMVKVDAQVEEEPEAEADEDIVEDGSDEEGEEEPTGLDKEDKAGSSDDGGDLDDGEDSDGTKTYDDETDSADDNSDNEGKKKKPKQKKVFEVKEYPADPYLIRRESTLLSLVLRHFKQRVIVFFNEKVQCHRMLVMFKIFGLKAVQVQGNLTQQERMDAIEQFQRGDVDYLLATDLVSRGLDIPNVKTIINFSFPNEPKRYLHRVGRTARAGMHGTSVTLCNDVERQDIKKLTRKLGHQVTPYSMQPKQVQRLFDMLASKLDQLVKDLQIEEAGDQELQKAFMEARKAENMIKFKDEIKNRPKSVWLKNEAQKQDIRDKSKEDLGNISKKFDEQITIAHKEAKEKSKQIKKRDQKKLEKKQKAKPGDSKFENDAEKAAARVRKPKPEGQ